MMAMILTAQRSWAVRIGLLGIVACVAVAFCLVGGAGPSPDGADLADLVAQFQSIPGLRFSAVAEVVVVFPPEGDEWGTPNLPAGVPVLGYMEYSAAGDHYKVNSYLDPDKCPGMQTQVAYDGEKFQLLLSNGTLSCSAHDNAGPLPVLLNPMLQLLQFRYPLTDQNYHQFEPRLKDVRTDATPPEFFNVDWVQVQEGDRLLERAVFPGGTHEEQAYVHHVYVVPGSRNMPVRIDRVTEHGRVTSAEFSDYVRRDSVGGPSFWPQNVLLRAFDSSGAEVGRVSYALSDIAVDVAYSQEAFAISPDSALRVWDDDRREFVTPAQNPG